jgi:hypothetical protein
MTSKPIRAQTVERLLNCARRSDQCENLKFDLKVEIAKIQMVRNAVPKRSYFRVKRQLVVRDQSKIRKSESGEI